MELELIYENMLLLEYSEKQAEQLIQQSKISKERNLTQENIGEFIGRMKKFIPDWQSVLSQIPQGSINKTYLDKTKQATFDANILYQIAFWFTKNDPVAIRIWSGLSPADLEDRLSMFKTYVANKVYFNQIATKNKSLLNINVHRTYNDFLGSLREMYEITQGSSATDDVSHKDLGKWYSNPNVKFFMQSGAFTCFETKTFDGTKDFIYNIFNYDRNKNYEYGDISDGYHPYCTGTYERYWDQYSKANPEYRQYWIFKDWPYGEKIPTPPPTETDIGFVGKKYLHSMQDSYDDYLDREDEHIETHEVIDTDLLRILTKIPYLELNKWNIYDLSAEELIDRLTYSDVVNYNISSTIKDKLGPLLQTKDIPAKLKTLIYEFISGEGRNPYFAEDWVLAQLYDDIGGGPPTEMLEAVGEYIEETGEIPHFFGGWITDILVNEPMPEPIMNSIISYIKRRGDIPDHSAVVRYFNGLINDDALPERVKAAIYYFIYNSQDFPHFAKPFHPFLRKELNNGTFTDEALEVLYYRIRKQEGVPSFADEWVTGVLNSPDEPPDGLLDAICYLLKSKSGTGMPESFANWVLDQLKKDPIPKDILKSIYDRIRKNAVLPWFLKPYIRAELEKESPKPELIDSVMMSISQHGVGDEVIYQYVYRKLYEEETPKELEEAIYSFISKYVDGHEVFDVWLTKKLLDGEMPKDVLEKVIDNYYVRPRFPKYIKDWLRQDENLMIDEINPAFHGLIETLIMRNHRGYGYDVMPEPFKSIIEYMMDNDKVPFWLAHIIQKYIDENKQPPHFALAWYSKKKLKESTNITTFKKYWGI